MVQVERKPGEPHGAIRFIAYGDTPTEIVVRDRVFIAVLLLHMALIGALAAMPARDASHVDTSTLAFIVENDENLTVLGNPFQPRAGSVTGENDARAPVANRRAAPSLLGKPALAPPPPEQVPASIPVPQLAGASVPVPDMAYARSLIERALEGQEDPLGIERATGTTKTIEELMSGPTNTPFSRAPELLNPGEIQSFLLRRYPSSLMSAGLGGRALLWLLIDEKGEVRKAVLHTGSGYKQLDKAALDAVPKMEFSAAMNNGRNVPVWVQQPINFRAH